MLPNFQALIENAKDDCSGHSRPNLSSVIFFMFTEHLLSTLHMIDAFTDLFTS